jgi:hypothetical protein
MPSPCRRCLLIWSPFKPQPVLRLPESTVGNPTVTDTQKRRALRSLFRASALEQHRGLWHEATDLLLLEALAEVAGIDLQRGQIDAESAFDPALADCLLSFDTSLSTAILRAAPIANRGRATAAGRHAPASDNTAEGLRCRTCDLPLARPPRAIRARQARCPYCGVERVAPGVRVLRVAVGLPEYEYAEARSVHLPESIGWRLVVIEIKGTLGRAERLPPVHHTGEQRDVDLPIERRQQAERLCFG